MHTRVRVLSLAVYAMIAIAGCAETQPADVDRARLPIMPLAVGNRWIGHNLYFDTLGNSTVITVDTLEIVSSMSVNGDTWFVTNTGVRLISRSDGLWTGSATGPDLQIALHPSSVGDVFGRRTVIHDTDTTGKLDTIIQGQMVVAVAYPMDVPNGSFRVTGYRIHQVRPDGVELTDTDPLWNEDDEYYAPGIGPVRKIYRDYSRRSPDGFRPYRIWELLEARVK